MSKPTGLRIPSIRPSAPPSAGVTDGQRSRSRASAAGSAVLTLIAAALAVRRVRVNLARERPPVGSTGRRSRAPSGLVPQQFVDRGFRARLLVDALDDHCAVETWSRCAGLRGPSRQRARNDDRVGGHLALERFAGLTIDD